MTTGSLVFDCFLCFLQNISEQTSLAGGDINAEIPIFWVKKASPSQNSIFFKKNAFNSLDTMS